MVAKNMTVIDTMRISPSQCIQIVRIGEQYLAIAVSKDQVTLLTKLDEDELIIKSDGEETTPLDFSTVWESIKNTKGSKEKSNEEEETFIKNND